MLATQEQEDVTADIANVRGASDVKVALEAMLGRLDLCPALGTTDASS